MDAERGRTSPDEIVTLVIQHHVRTGGEAEYERHLSKIIAAAATFPGHLGVNVICPPQSRRADSHYTIVVRFDTHRHLEAWIGSPTRRDFIRHVEHLLVKDDSVAVKTGLEFWFTPPGDPAPPRPYKQYLITLSAIFPLTVIVPWVLRPIIQGIPFLNMQFINTFITDAVIVALMVWVVMPRFTRLVAKWLFQ
jgi:hypothetical protein